LAKFKEVLYQSNVKIYFAVDIGINYKLNGVKTFVTLGASNTSVDKAPRSTINNSTKFYFWFSNLNYCDCKINSNVLDNFELLFQTHGKSSFKLI
jgi:hypothetical protein